MAVLSQSTLSNIDTIEFKNSNGNTTSLVLNPSGLYNSPTIGGTPLTYGNYGSYSFASLPANCTYRGMTLTTPQTYTSLPTSSTESDSVSGGGYKVVALGSWAMVSGWVSFSKISSTPKLYQFSFTLPSTSLKFASAPSICIQEENGVGSYSGSSNYLNTTYASCSYSSDVLTMKITKYAAEAGSIVFFIAGRIQ